MKSPLGSLLTLIALLAALLAAALEDVTLQLKWKHQFQFAGYYAAIAKGFYREAGLHVTLREADSRTDVVSEVISGKAQFGISGSDLGTGFYNNLTFFVF